MKSEERALRCVDRVDGIITNALIVLVPTNANSAHTPWKAFQCLMVAAMRINEKQNTKQQI
jgi:hypothetical protein